MPDILHRLTIHAPPERVFEALTTAEGIRNWWTRDADLDARIGGAGEFRFYGGSGVTSVRVDALDAPHRVGWTTLSANAPGGWDGTTITFELSAHGTDTVLSFAHHGFAEANGRLRARDDRLGLLSRQLAAVRRDRQRRAASGKGFRADDSLMLKTPEMRRHFRESERRSRTFR